MNMSLGRLLLPVFAAGLAGLSGACKQTPPPVTTVGATAYDGRYIDAHLHAHPHVGRGPNRSMDMAGAARAAVEAMDENGIVAAILMPPPFPPDGMAMTWKSFRGRYGSIPTGSPFWVAAAG